MANEFYKRQVQERSVSQQAVSGPDMSQVIEGNNRRNRSIIAGLDSLVGMGAGLKKAGDAYSKKQTEKAEVSGKKSAEENAVRPESDFWSNNAGQDAYDTVKAENVVNKMPSFIEQYLADNTHPTKPFDELEPEERRAMIGKARAAFFAQDELKDAPHKQKAEEYANEVINKMNGTFDKQAKEVGAAKAGLAIEEAVNGDLQAFQGSNTEFDAIVDTKMKTYQQVLMDPSGEKTKATIVSGLLKASMAEKPDINAYNYLKSPEGKARFGHLEGYDKAVDMADRHTLAVRKAEVIEIKTSLENDFHSNLSVGSMKNEADIDKKLSSYDAPEFKGAIDAKDKFILKNKALKYLKIAGDADNLKDAIATKNFGVVNAATEDARVEAFARQGITKADSLPAILTAQIPDKTHPTMVKKQSIIAWLKDGFNPPEFMKKTLNTELIPTFEKEDPMMERAAMHQQLGRSVGESGVHKMFTPETQASIDMYRHIQQDTSLPTPKDKALAYNKYLANTKRTLATGWSHSETINREVREEKFMGEIASFLQDGGGDTTLDFGIPSDLQPITTTRNNDDVDPTGYASKTVQTNYAIYRNVGYTSEDALRKAKNDFLYKNYWVDWKDKSTYVPREYGADFAETGMKFIKARKDLETIASNNGVSHEDLDIVERKVTIQPASDFSITRKMAVYYDGIEQDMVFSYSEYDKFKANRSEALDEKTALEKADRDLRTTPEFKAKQDRKQKLLQGLDFLNNRYGFRFGD